MTNEETVRVRRADLERIGEVLAGLQVPVSLPDGARLLGAAYEPWLRLKSDRLGLGWHAPEHFVEALTVPGLLDQVEATLRALYGDAVEAAYDPETRDLTVRFEPALEHVEVTLVRDLGEDGEDGS